MTGRMKRESEDFRRIFVAGISTVASITDRTRGAIQQDIADLLGVSKKTIESYQSKGSVPEDDQLDVIMEYFLGEVGKDYIGYEWASNFFDAAGAQYIDDHLYRHFPEIRERQENLGELPHNLPQQEYLKYIDRPNVENEIRRAFDNDASIVFIDGFSGNGKTSTAFKFAKDIVARIEKIDTGLVVWFAGNRTDRRRNTSTMLELFESVLKVTGHTGISSMGTREISEAAIKVLRQTKAVIILDGFERMDDPEVINFLSDKLPLGCKAIITSQTSRSAYPQLTRCFTVKVPGMTKPEVVDLLTGLATQDQWLPQPDLSDSLLGQIMRITKGNPFAVKSIYGMLRAEMSTGYDPDKALSEFESLHDGPLASLHEASLSRTWSLLSRDSQDFVVLCGILPKGISDTAITAVTHWSREDAIKAISACRDSNMIELYQARGDNVDTNVRYSIHPLVYQFVTTVTDSDEYDNWTKKLVNYYVEDSQQVGFCYNDVKALYKYDIDGEYEALRYVLDFCEAHELFGDFYTLSENTKYYFYVRGHWEFGDQSIHIRRARAAERCGNVVGQFDSVVYHVNCAAKRKEIDEARRFIAVAEKILGDNKAAIPNAALCKFNHAKALTDYFDDDLNSALEAWNLNLTAYRDELDEHDLNANERWRAKCLFKIGGEKNEGNAVSALTNLAKKAKATNFLRAYIDANLALGDYYCKTQQTYEAEQIANAIEDAVFSNRDNKYLAEYYILLARVNTQKKDEALTLGNLQKALSYLKATMHNQRIVEVITEFHDYAYLLV